MTEHQRRYQELFILPGMRAQVNGYAAPATVTAVGEWDNPAWEGNRRLGNREVWVVLDCDRADGVDPEPVAMADAEILATWSPKSGYDDGFAAVKTYSNLYLQTLDARRHERTCGYWYTVMSNGMSHVAFATRDQLLSWMAERGLNLTAELPEQGVASGQAIAGSYRESFSPHSLGFDAIDGVRTREMSNGRWTAATITRDGEGVRTVHSVGPNCRARLEFDAHVWPAPDSSLWFYEPGQFHAFDAAVVREAGTWEAMYSGKTLAELQCDRPNVILCTEAEFRAQANAAACTAPTEITPAAYREALDVLPPQGWTRAGGTESFKLCEYHSNDVTNIYVQIGDRCFKFRDLGTMPHAQVIERVERSGLLAQPAMEDDATGMSP